MQGKRVTIFGGSGFIGRAISRELTQAGAWVTIGCTDVEAAKAMKTMGQPGQVLKTFNKLTIYTIIFVAIILIIIFSLF